MESVIPYSKIIKPYSKLARWKEYYGSVIIASALAIFMTSDLEVWKIIVAITANLFANFFAFMINDLEDAEDDARDPKKKLRNPVSAGAITYKKAAISTYITVFLSQILYASLGWQVFVTGLTLNLIGFTYSYKKIRLKSKPFIDILSHGLHRALLFLVPLAMAPTIHSPYLATFLGIAIFFTSCLGDIANEIRDHKADREAGIKNTGSIFNLVRFRKLIFYPAFIICALVFVSVIFESSYLTIALFSFVAVLVVVHYYFKWYRYSKDVAYYPYSQQVLTVFGLMLLLNPIK